MATLPPGWAVDYDGQRWFYCYTATSHTQYHFPKPGDEFPEFSLVNYHSENDGLLPEEKLESERQVRKRAALRGTQGRTMNGKRSDEEIHDREMQIDKESDWDEENFCFESFGYLGPGSRSETMISGHTMDGSAGKAAQRPPSSKLASVGTRTGTGDGECKAKSPTPTVSEPSTRNDANMRGHIVGAFELPFLSARPCQPTVPPSDSSFIFNREIASSSAGTIAELVSESTALCEEEINPPPVELPSTGASWLDPRPLSGLVNQCPVELPSMESPPPSRHSIPTGEDGADHRPGQQMNIATGTDAVQDGNRSAWCTNWMSTTAEAQAPSRPPKVIPSQSNLPSRPGGSPQLPSNTTPEEKLHQEILDFFPAALPLPEADTQIAKDALFTMRITENSRPIISNSALSHFPSVLRPGPRKSSQPPGTTAKPGSQNSSKPSSSQTPEAKPSPTVSGGPQFRAFQPVRPQNLMTTTAKPDLSPPVTERHAPAQALNGVLAMPDPKDFVRSTARSSTLPKILGQH